MRTGAAGLLRLVERYGLERLLGVGRADVRPRRGDRAQLLREDPGRPLRRARRDGQQRHRRRPDPVRGRASRWRARRAGSTSRTRPTRSPGPVNCPVASTVSGSRIAITMLAGGGEAPNEGHFRPLEVVARPGSMFHPDARRRRASSTAGRRCRRSRSIYNAVSKALPEPVPPCSGGDLCALVWWGMREQTGEPWARRLPASRRPGRPRRAATAPAACIHVIEAATRFSPLRGVGGAGTRG